MKETPKNIEAEQVVLAGVACGSININDIKFEDFYDQRHKKIFELIIKLRDEIPNIDSTLITNEVDKLGINNEVGQSTYVIDVIDGKHPEAKYNHKIYFEKLKADTDLRLILQQTKQLTYDIENSNLSPEEAKTKISTLNFKVSNKTISKVNELKWVNPLEQEAFYGLTGEVVRTLESHTESDPAALLFSFLTAFGNIIGNQPHFTIEASKHPARLFTVLVGKSSKGRKGTSWGYIEKIFNLVEECWVKNNIGSGLSSGEGVIWAVRDEIIRQVPIKEKKITVGFDESIEDPGIEDKRFLISEGEFVQALKVMEREGNILSPLLRNSWDTGNLRTLTKNSPARATGAHISIIGHITNQELLRYLRSTEQANGFGNRFLWVCVKRSGLLPFGGDIEESELIRLANKVKDAVWFARDCELMEFSEDAKELWISVYPELSREIPGLIGSITGRAEAYVLRLSLIYALLDHSKLIEIEHLMAALAVWRYADDSARYIFHDKTGSNDADKIIDTLRKYSGRLSRTDLSEKAFNRNKRAEEIEAALDILKFNNQIREYLEPGEGRGITIIELLGGTNYELRGKNSKN